MISHRMNKIFSLESQADRLVRWTVEWKLRKCYRPTTGATEYLKWGSYGWTNRARTYSLLRRRLYSDNEAKVGTPTTLYSNTNFWARDFVPMFCSAAPELYIVRIPRVPTSGLDLSRFCAEKMNLCQLNVHSLQTNETPADSYYNPQPTCTTNKGTGQ
jgi:hypothetical protein